MDGYCDYCEEFAVASYEVVVRRYEMEEGDYIGTSDTIEDMEPGCGEEHPYEQFCSTHENIWKKGGALPDTINRRLLEDA